MPCILEGDRLASFPDPSRPGCARPKRPSKHPSVTRSALNTETAIAPHCGIFTNLELHLAFVGEKITIIN
jgi:hypothetical protein